MQLGRQGLKQEPIILVEAMDPIEMAVRNILWPKCTAFNGESAAEKYGMCRARMEGRG